MILCGCIVFDGARRETLRQGAVPTGNRWEKDPNRCAPWKRILHSAAHWAINSTNSGDMKAGISGPFSFMVSRAEAFAAFSRFSGG